MEPGHDLRIEITFPGNLAVVATHAGFEIVTDQPVNAGGDGSAPSPFDLFLASIGTCTGFFALRFCQQRGIATHGLALTLQGERSDDHGRFAVFRVEIRTPDGFPDKYRDALVRSVDQCTVKRHIVEPPTFEVRLTEPSLATAS
jgi:putative redox protein